ncbi:hypothetical protein LC092_09075 [Stappia stellulata]|uniref:hypothetical protein n=1 Tax=Stappia stellulata TaxID=71235 RepID=UPI001CD796C1|nr:hypothetical protein [Stappia stellulata]MCA1242588.1 hypothetical protein [Stappia stellulata]
MRIALLFQNKKQSYIKIKVYLNSRIIIIELNSILIQILAVSLPDARKGAGAAAGPDLGSGAERAGRMPSSALPMQDQPVDLKRVLS